MAATCEQSGFNLLEVLVTLVILSLGILGAAGLQRAALQNGHSALLCTQAALYTYDMADRMRANRAVAVSSPSPYAQPLRAAPCPHRGKPGSHWWSSCWP